MKKLILALVSVLAVTVLTACGTKSGGGELVIGTPKLNGDFVSGFTNSAYDRIVRDMISGYGTYIVNPNGEFVLNETVVKKEDVTTDADGNKTYTFEIADNLKWSDGTAITAKDYVFGVLFRSSPQWKLMGATDPSAQALLGYKDYASGASEEFPGIKYLDTHKFAVTISAAELPYYYETSYAAIGPDPIHVWGKGGDISSTGSSIVFANATEEEGAETEVPEPAEDAADTEWLTYYLAVAATKEEADYTPETWAVLTEAKTAAEAVATTDAEAVAKAADALSKGIDGLIFKAVDLTDFGNLQEAAEYVAKTERRTPTVTGGPYKFKEFKNDQAVVVKDDNYTGDYRGHTAKIETVIVKYVNAELDVDSVRNGDIDITTGVVEGAKIEAAKADSNVTAHSYKRNGYGFMAFHTDFGPVADKKVRQAMAYLTDRNAFVTQILEGYGVLVNGEYGLAQWMYQEKEAEINEKLTNYVLNVDKANELLNETDWVYNETGGAYEAGEGKFRYNSKGEKLVINHAGSTENAITVLINTQLTENLKKAGMEFNVEELDFQIMLSAYYNLGPASERKYHTFNLASTFAEAYDPYFSYHSSFLGTTYNATQTNNPKFDELTVKMRSLDPSQRDEYLEAWMEYQVEWNDYLPQIPLYSNEYFDIYNNRITGVETTSFLGIGAVALDIELSK